MIEEKIAICIPTYNECENIEKLISEIIKLKNNTYVVVVDDNSQDGTSAIIKKNFEKLLEDKIFIISRNGKLGRGSAVRDGFIFLKNKIKDINIFIEMDADFSHSISDLIKGIEIFKKEKPDVLLGSRYPSGKIINWPIQRRIFSFLSNLLIRIFVSRKIHDYTNCFRFYNFKSVELMISMDQKNKGFIYLSETLVYFLKEKFVIQEFIITFKNRVRGKSNTNFREIISSLLGLFNIIKNYYMK